MALRDLSRMVGRWPHEVLRLTPEQLTLALECRSAGEASDIRNMQRAGGVQPVVVLG